MEQKLRLVQGRNPSRHDERAVARRALAVPGQIVWKDARGATHMAAVVTRDVSEQGARVECLQGAAIPLYRLVYLQVDRAARGRADLPDPLRKPTVPAAIFRVGECSAETGAPREYALRLLIEPERKPNLTAVPAWDATADVKSA